MLFEIIDWNFVSEHVDTEDLIDVQNKIQEILKKRKIDEISPSKKRDSLRSRGDYFSFDFHAKSDKRKAFPYVARLFWDESKNAIGRKFFKMRSEPVSTYVVEVKGRFYAKNGDIIEMQTGGDGERKFRSRYRVKNGKLVPLSNRDERSLADIVKKSSQNADNLKDSAKREENDI